MHSCQFEDGRSLASGARGDGGGHLFGLRTLPPATGATPVDGTSPPSGDRGDGHDMPMAMFRLPVSLGEDDASAPSRDVVLTRTLLGLR